MIEPGSWLPKGVSASGTLSLALDPVLEGWSSTWLRRSVIKVIAIDSGQAGRPLEAGGAGELNAHGTALDVVLRPRAKRQLLEALLGADLAGVELGANDWRLLDGLAGEVQRDLLDLLDGDEGQASPDRETRISIGAGGREFAMLACSYDFIVRTVKSGCRPEQARAVKLERRGTALFRTEVDVRVRVGRTSLTIDEARSIEPGDVLVLDRGISEPVELVLSECGGVVATAHLGKSDSRSILTF